MQKSCHPEKLVWLGQPQVGCLTYYDEQSCAETLLPSVQHFEGFDPEGFSLWFCDYKYPEENTVNYIVMNKVG